MNDIQQELIELHRLGVASLEAVKAAASDLREFDNMTTTEVASLLMELYPCAF
jgi:hypothetical protein